VKTEKAVQESPKDGPRHALLGLIYAGLGRCEEAKAEAKRAVDLLPETKDAFDGPVLVISWARIHMMCGDLDNALALLDRSLQTPSGITSRAASRSDLGSAPGRSAFPADAGEIRCVQIANGILQRPPKNLVSPSVRVCN
jgi:tetratricopeptide (TPR) repeat protein